ncbi:CAMK/RAD53 protein kinase [Mycena floridula]|nr:CAMK/RAD53 protein kinase [Mycena floridula]
MADNAADDEATQPRTQSTQDSSQILPSNDTHLWAYLMPVSHTLKRIDLWRGNLRYNVGRNQQNNQIVFPGLKISNNHCTIVWDNDEQNPTVVIHDKSTNGTFINGVKIGRDKSRALRDGNEVAFGTAIPQIERPNEDYRFIYRYVAGGRPSTGMFAVYDITAELGRGSFATVYKVVHHVTGEYYAAKMIHEPRRAGRTDQSVRAAATNFGREIRIMESLDHPNICQLKEVFYETEGDLGLILEYVQGGDLLEYIIKSEVGLSEAMGQHITYQICDALSYIHQLGVAHRDLKPENVLLTKDDPPIVKVADFGLAKVADNATMLRTMCGTPSYLAPEVVDSLPNVGYDHLVDSWSVGTIVFSMLTNMTPFQVDQSLDIANQIRTRTIDWEHIGHLSLHIQTFIRSLLEIAPTRRMTLTGALTHPWLAEYAAAPRYRFDGRIPIPQPVIGDAGPGVNHAAPMGGVVSADVAMAGPDGSTSQAFEKLRIKADGAPGASGPSQDSLFPGSQNSSVAREASRMLQRRSDVAARAHEGQGDIPEPSAEMRERIIKATEGPGSDNAEGSDRKRRHSELSLDQGSSNGASKKARESIDSDDEESDSPKPQNKGKGKKKASTTSAAADVEPRRSGRNAQKAAKQM